jgi:hypothetical protein
MESHPVRHGLRSKFRPEEDEILRGLVDRFGTNSWSEIACAIPGRNARQCRDRWKHYLVSEVRRPWTPDEDAILLEKLQVFGFKWTRIAGFFTERTDFDVKTRWGQIFRTHKRSLRNLSPPRSLKRGRDSHPKEAASPPPKRVRLPSLCVDPVLLLGVVEDSFSPPSAPDDGTLLHFLNERPSTFQ